MRGPFSAQAFKAQGIDVPKIYGEPVWFLPSIIKPAPEKTYDLGVIVHLSELAELTDTAGVHEKFVRYKVPAALVSSIRIITTLTQPTFAALEEKIKEITSCKRIASTSLHGLVIAEAYRLPCVYFCPRGRGPTFPSLLDEDQLIEHRVRDFYSGIGGGKLFMCGQRRRKQTNWEDVMQAIDTYWHPIDWSPQSFLETFPLPLAFNPLRGEELVDRSRFEQIKF